MRGSLWTWIWHRITAVVLVLLLGTHFAVMHFVNPTAEITFATSQVRLQSLLYMIVDFGMLLFALFHGLNGLRNIVLDYWPKAGKAVAWVLTVFGIIAVGYGSTALYAFLK
ncbi:MAG: hypothetical protein ACM3XM_01325 [Mycobacterium leprae]